MPRVGAAPTAFSSAVRAAHMKITAREGPGASLDRLDSGEGCRDETYTGP
jgi:hypothetical protein